MHCRTRNRISIHFTVTLLFLSALPPNQIHISPIRYEYVNFKYEILNLPASLGFNEIEEPECREREERTRKREGETGMSEISCATCVKAGDATRVALKLVTHRLIQGEPRGER